MLAPSVSVTFLILLGCTPSEDEPDAGGRASIDAATPHHHRAEIWREAYGPVLRRILATPPLTPDAGTSAPDGDAGAPSAPPDAGRYMPPDAGTYVPTDAGGLPAGGPLPVDQCDGAWVPDRLFTGEVALTFDDGPNAATTPSVLATLRAHHAPATFFINGRLVSDPAERAIVDEIVADPRFILANHTWSHPPLDTLSLAGAAAEVDGVEAILRARGETRYYFRFPFLRSTCGTMQIVRDRGLIPVGINVDSADWCYAGGAGVCEWEDVPERFRAHGMIAFVLHQLSLTGGGVLLLHDYHPYTAAHLDALLDAIEAAGYRFVRLDDVRALPRLNGERFVGDACRSDADCAFADDGYCHAAGFCTLPCEGTCPNRRGWAAMFCAPDAPDRGACVPRSSPLNEHCHYVPGTAARSLPRFVGASGLPVEWEVVCAPP